MSTSRDNGSGTIEKFDLENMGIAVRILLLCALELEICLGVKLYPHLPANVAKNVAGKGLTVPHSNADQSYRSSHRLHALATV